MDETKRPLRIPPEFATYAEQHDIFNMYKKLLEQVIIHKPQEPLSFLIDQLKKDDDDVLQVVILGPPASGKSTIAKMICSKLRTAYLTMDNIIAEADRKLRTEAMKLREQNQPIPTEMWVQLVESRLKLFDCVKKGWVMEGFPQTREQALALQARGIHPKQFVLLQAPDTVLIERATGKRNDPVTNDIYHTTFDWPSNAEVVDRLQEVPGNTEPEVVDRLVVYHRHIADIRTCYTNTETEINADQPKGDVFSQVMTYLSREPRSVAPHTPRIILLGPTGCGKANQAALLASKYNLVHVSCGQLIKQTIADDSKSGHACKNYVQKGMLVPDAIVLNILKERLSQLDCVSRGWVLHGYPRTREQAEQLTGAGLVQNRAFFLDVPNDSILERLTLRATDPVTGDRYHSLYNPPRTQEVKDRLQVHPKDREENVRKRLAQYHAFAEELADYYEDGQRVNADQDPHTVFECLESMIVNPLPKVFS